MSKLAEKIANRVLDESGTEVIPEIRRTRAGYWQRAQGTWSWSMDFKRGGMIGSQYTATECAKAKVWHLYNWGAVDVEIIGIE